MLDGAGVFTALGGSGGEADALSRGRSIVRVLVNDETHTYRGRRIDGPNAVTADNPFTGSDTLVLPGRLAGVEMTRFAPPADAPDAAAAVAFANEADLIWYDLPGYKVALIANLGGDAGVLNTVRFGVGTATSPLLEGGWSEEVVFGGTAWTT